MNILNIPGETIEWPKPDYEYLTSCFEGDSQGHTKHLNLYANQGWELIHVSSNGASVCAAYYWRKLKVLGVPVK